MAKLVQDLDQRDGRHGQYGIPRREITLPVGQSSGNRAKCVATIASMTMANDSPATTAAREKNRAASGCR